MLKSKVGWSTDVNAYNAGKKAAESADGLKDAKIAFMFNSAAYNQSQVIKGASEVLSGVPIIGCTSFTGILTPDGFISDENGFTGIMTMADEDLTIGVAGSPKKESARETGREIARMAMTDAGKNSSPAYFYMVANPGEEESYLKGIEDIIGRVPFFGGSAADNDITGKWQLFAKEKVFADGAAVAFFYTDKAFANKYTGAYKETDKVGIVTKVDGKRRLAEIDGKPALKVYADWRKLNTADLMGGNLLAASVVAPLGVKDRLGDLVAIRHPMGGNPDYSINLGNDVAKNTAVILMEASVDDLIASTYSTLEETKKRLGCAAGAFLLVHCGGRRAGIGDRINEVAANIKKAAGDVPFLGVFTFGEYGYEEQGVNTCGGLMLSFNGFAK